MDPSLMIIATVLPFVLTGIALGIIGAVKAGRLGHARRLQRQLADRGWASSAPALPGDASSVSGRTDLRVTGGDDVTDSIGLTGTWRGYDVAVRAEHFAAMENNQKQYFASMRLPVDWADGVWIQSMLWSGRDGPRIELPADAFQTPLSATGDAAAAIALCNPSVRAELASGLVAIHAGHARIRLSMNSFSVRRVEVAFDALQRVCDALPAVERTDALEQIVLNDPWPSMRGAAFDALAGEREPVRDALIDLALGSEWVDLRARAAVYRGLSAIDEALAVLLDDKAAPGPRAYVAALVATHAPSPAVVEVIAQALEHDHPSRATHWLDAARVCEGPLRVIVARGLHARIDHDASVRPIYYRAAADFGDDAWYPALVKGFDEAEDEVILAALATVGEVADLSRIEHLKHYAGESTGLGAGVRVERPWSRALKRAADATIARIQDRCGGAAGGLALADHAEGALATVDES